MAWIAGGCLQGDILHRSLPGLKTALPPVSRVINLSSLLVHYCSYILWPLQAECIQVSDGERTPCEQYELTQNTVQPTMQSWILEEFKEMTVCTRRHIQTCNKYTLYADREWTFHIQRTYKIQHKKQELLLHLWVWDFGGFFSQAAALCRDQVIVLCADVLVWIVKTAWTGPRRRPG